MNKLFGVLALGLILGLTVLSIAADAGEWGSSGGGFSNNLMNPWFVKNLQGHADYDVTYCLDIDAKTFSAAPETIRALFSKASAYWAQQFRGESILGIAKQRFVEKPGKCDGTADLKLQFGYGTLTPEQLAEFKKQESEPEDFVAITIRTDYVARELKGRGFIYFGSDHGEHAYNHGQDVATNLWQHEGVLYRVMVHELGHVFGLPHVPGIPMGQDFPEFVLKHYANYREVGQLPEFFRGNTQYTFCGTPDGGWPIPVPPSTRCLVLTFDADFSRVSLTTVDSQGNASAPKSLAATGVRTRNLDFPVKVVFNREQLVFPVSPGEKAWNGPARQTFTAYFDGSADLGIQSLLVDVTPTELRIHGVKDGKLVLLLDQSSKAGLRSSAASARRPAPR